MILLVYYFRNEELSAVVETIVQQQLTLASLQTVQLLFNSHDQRAARRLPASSPSSSSALPVASPPVIFLSVEDAGISCVMI
jgi:hypothetical protein